MAYQVLIGALALTVGAILRVLASKPEADKPEGTAPKATKRGDGDMGSQRVRRTARGASRAGLDRSNLEFNRALDLLREERSSTAGGHVFITGKPGTGKSTLINHFLETTDTASTVVLAPTGVAALNVRGQTVFRFFNFGIDVTPEKVRKSPRPKNAGLYRNLSTIVIDEASMLKADLLDCVQEFLFKHGPRPGEPFGGVRMVFVGDLYQLPPVVTPDAHAIFNGGLYETPYFFSAHALAGELPELVELRRIYRQEDAVLIGLLDRIRTGSVDGADLRKLNERVGPGEASAICLTATRKTADRINGRKLDRLGGEPSVSLAEIRGDFPKVYYPTETELAFKVGARVMMLNNDPAGRWVNGSMGEIESIGRNGRWIRIRLQEERNEQTSDEVVDVEPYTWESIRFTLKDGAIATETTGSFTQLPFRLAWAVTIHKSQGKTFRNITVDLDRGAFAPGQTYVALSRSTSFEGIALRRPIDRHSIFADRRVEKFLDACRDRST